MLSRDLSPSAEEHLFAVRAPVPGVEMVRLSGEYKTKVFEGAYQDAPRWEEAFRRDLAAEGLAPRKLYFFYTTCPKCAAAYGKNYVVAVAETGAMQ